MEDFTIESPELRKILSANIKAGRKRLGLSQEKLAEWAGLSVQMINSVEGCRAWVGENTLISLAETLGVEVFQLLTPPAEEKKLDLDLFAPRLLLCLKQEIKADVEARFDRFLKLERKG
ncbi:hypothetical protein AGMMS50293_24420 [Spirochaetia bacterium]|nr:hypothetical protein AGMMS50293_24420 [Spirochaetia bacterium]